MNDQVYGMVWMLGRLWGGSQLQHGEVETTAVADNEGCTMRLAVSEETEFRRPIVIWGKLFQMLKISTR